MFEFTNPAASNPQSPRPLAASIAIHSAVVVLLFTIRFSGASNFPAPQEHFTLIAPSRETPVTIPRVSAARPREFHPPPAAPAHLEIPAAVIPAPAIETPKLAIPEIPHPPPANIDEVKPAAPVQARKLIVNMAGFGSAEASVNVLERGRSSAIGSFESAHLTEGEPTRRITQSSGFSDVSTTRTTAARPDTIVNAAFGDTTVQKAPAPRQTQIAARITPVEILFKPKPAFTADARAKHIEGEVLLEVQFTASGELHVLSVVHGLGYGLDQNAMEAAQGIRFRPATRDDALVDSSALVHIVFQLAN